jgi:hypothetical protein
MITCDGFGSREWGRYPGADRQSHIARAAAAPVRSPEIAPGAGCGQLQSGLVELLKKRPPIRTSGSEKRCREWLESIMAERQRPDKAKGVYMAQAKEKYCVSDRGFKRAWEQAKANTGATAWGWGKAGAKPRANQSTKSRHRIDSPM